MGYVISGKALRARAGFGSICGVGGKFCDPPIISQFSVHEMRCVLCRKESARAIPPDAAELSYRKFFRHIEDAVVKVIPYGPAVAFEFDRVVRACYRAGPVVPIRALDGLLLASARVARTADLISTDLRMRAAGLLLGLQVLPE